MSRAPVELAGGWMPGCGDTEIGGASLPAAHPHKDRWWFRSVVMMTAGTMHMAVIDFLLTGFPHVKDLNVKVKFLAG